MRLAEPVITDEDREAVARTLESGWVSGYGPSVEQFESEFSRYCGAGFGIATPSGTTALHLALATLGIGPGDEVIMPSFTMIAVYYAALQLGATPVLCDSCPISWNIDAGAAEAAVTPRTRAIVAVHMYGLPCDMDELRGLAHGAGAALVEDAAEAHGAVYRGKRAGSLGRLGCFSFFANKIITCGEGGMLTTSDPDLAERARSLRELGRVPGQRYVYAETGYSYRMLSVSAALGLSQLSRVATLGARRTRNAELYRTALSGVPGLTFAPRVGDRTGSDWRVGVLIGPESGMERNRLAERLAAAGVETRPFFVPVHRQPFYRCDGEFPVADRLGEQGILLPSGSNLVDEDIDLVSNLINEAANA